MDFLDKLHFIGWGVAFVIAGILVWAVVKNRKKKQE